MNSCIIPHTVGKSKNGFLVCQGHEEPAVAILVPAFAPDMGKIPERVHRVETQFPIVWYDDYEQARRHNLALAICKRGMLEMVKVLSMKDVQGIVPIYQRSTYGPGLHYADYYTRYDGGTTSTTTYWFRFSSPGYETTIYAQCRWCLQEKLLTTTYENTKKNYFRFFDLYTTHNSNPTSQASSGLTIPRTSSH